MSLQKHHMSWLCAFLRHSQTFSFKNDNKKHDSSENQMRWKNVWSANDDNNFYSLPYIKNASSLLFTMPSTLVMCLQITVNPFQSASEHTKSRETTSGSKTRLVICFQICHRGKHTHTQIHTIKKAERYGKGGVHQKKRISTVPLTRTQLFISKETEPDDVWRGKTLGAASDLSHTLTAILNETRILFLQTNILRWQSPRR